MHRQCRHAGAALPQRSASPTPGEQPRAHPACMYDGESVPGPHATAGPNWKQVPPVPTNTRRTVRHTPYVRHNRTPDC